MTKVKYTSKNFPKLDFSLMPPFAKQKEILEDKTRYKVIAFGRQSGKSWTGRRELLERAVNKGQRCWWIFPANSAAKHHWRELVLLLENSKFPYRYINRSEMYVEFWSGGYIAFRSADEPKNLRGSTLDFILLDEAAFIPEEVWTKVVQPALTASRGEAMLVSTPNGRNWFWTMYKIGLDPRYPDYKSWHMTSLESPYQDVEALKAIRNTVSDLVWREEYLAEFLTDGGGVFTNVEKQAKVIGITKPQENAVYIAGIDWGDNDDYTTFTVIDKFTREQVFGTRFRIESPAKKIMHIVALLEKWEPEKTIIEINGIGKPLFRMLKETLSGTIILDDLEQLEDDEAFSEDGIYGGFRLKSVYSNNEIKRNLIERLAADIEFGRIDILADNQDDLALDEFAKQQLSEFSTFKRKRTPRSDQVTYAAAEGSKDDCIIALALAYSGMPKPRKFRKHWIERDTEQRNPFRRGRKYA